MAHNVVYTGREQWEMIRLYALNNDNASAAAREYARLHGTGPTAQTIRRMNQRLIDNGIAESSSRSDRGASHLDSAVEEAVVEYVQNHPRTGTHGVARIFQISHTTVLRILHEENMHPYHFMKVQGLKPEDYPPRLHFSNWFIDKTNQNVNFPRNILWTDEATFTRGGFFNIHNEHLWDTNNPHAMWEHNFQHRFSVNVWAGVIDNVLVGPYVFPGTLNGTMYLDFLQNVLPDLIDDSVPLARINNIVFMHDGAPPHFARTVRHFLDTEYPNRWIGRGGPVAWPPRSPDLNPLDFYLWGYMKSEVYKTPVTTVNDLINRIHRTADRIKNNPETIRRATSDSMLKRVGKCSEKHGGHFQAFLH